jgi:hypothetical protein
MSEEMIMAKKTVHPEAIKFASLNVGKTFRFESEWSLPFSGMKKGLLVKTSRSGYKFVECGMECRIGSKNALIVPTST